MANRRAPTTDGGETDARAVPGLGPHQRRRDCRGGTRTAPPKTCGDYIIADTEFFRPPATNIDAENLSDLDDSSDDSPDQKYDGSWGRTYDAAIIMVDCNGNLKYELFSEKMDGARTPLSMETRQRAIGELRGMDAAHLPGNLQSQAANILRMIRVAKFVFRTSLMACVPRITIAST